MSMREIIIETQPKRNNQFNSRPNDYLFWSILNTIFCSLIFGSIAVYMSIKIRENKNAGDFTKAEKNSRKALVLNIVATSFGFIGTIIFFVIFYLYFIKS